MRIASVPLILTAMAGALALSACDQRPPLPPFTEKAAPAAEALPAASETLSPQAQSAACCACPSLAAPACPEVAPTQVAATPAAAPSRAPRQRAARTPQRSEQAYAHRPARVQPATYYPAPSPAVDYGHQSHQPVGHQGGYVVQPAPEPIIRDGYARRHDTYQGTRHTYGHERYAYVTPAPAHQPPPAPPPQLIYQSHGAHGGYVSPPQGYAHAVGGGSGPCCAGAPVQAAGRDSAGYLTWSGKRPPAPYY